MYVCALGPVVILCERAIHRCRQRSLVTNVSDHLVSNPFLDRVQFAEPPGVCGADSGCPIDKNTLYNPHRPPYYLLNVPALETAMRAVVGALSRQPRL